MVKPNWKITFVLVWMLFVLSLSAWWLWYALALVEELTAGAAMSVNLAARQKSMLLWEGMTWMVLLLLGGATLIYFIILDEKRTQSMKNFMAAFSHDLKTSLASLRLQVDILKEDFANNLVVDRLANDTLRLQMQLENTLVLGQGEKVKPYMEKLSMKQVVHRLKPYWPELNIEIDQDYMVYADERALVSILKNILHNSVIHGNATMISIVGRQLDNGQVRFVFSDNGLGVTEKKSTEGQGSSLPSTGMGLTIVKKLAEDMKGRVRLSVDPFSEVGPFEVELTLEGSST